MIDEAELELDYGSGNVFRDLGDPDADLKQAKAVLAARVISALDGRALTVRKASAATGFAASDFSRIRNANLGRFTIDRLIRMLAALDSAAGVTVHVGERAPDPGVHDQESRRALDVPKRKPVIVDKSYAQGVGSLSELQKDWDLLFPDAFFFEVASTDAQARERCLRKLREVHRVGGVHVAPNLGELLRKEIHGLSRAGTPSENLIGGLDLDAFLSIKFDDLSKARREALDGTELDFGHDVDGLITRANMLQGCVPGTCEGTTEERKQAYRQAKETIAHDKEFVAGFFADFVCRGKHAPPGAPLLAAIARRGGLGPEWTIYRWLQVQLLYGLELLEKRGRLAPEMLTPNQREKLQHDVIDIEYVVLGVLQGALATRDKRMSAMFTLLRPDGVVVRSVAAS